MKWPKWLGMFGSGKTVADLQCDQILRRFSSMKKTVNCVSCKKDVEGFKTTVGTGGYYYLGTYGPSQRKLYLCDACAGW